MTVNVFALDIEWEIECRYIPYKPATHWQPDEGGYYEDVSIWHDGACFDKILTRAAIYNITMALEEMGAPEEVEE